MMFHAPPAPGRYHIPAQFQAPARGAYQERSAGGPILVSPRLRLPGDLPDSLPTLVSSFAPLRPAAAGRGGAAALTPALEPASATVATALPRRPWSDQRAARAAREHANDDRVISPIPWVRRAAWPAAVMRAWP